MSGITYVPYSALFPHDVPNHRHEIIETSPAARRSYSISNGPVKQPEQPYSSRCDLEKLIALRLKQEGRTSITRSQLDRLVEDELSKRQINGNESRNRSQDHATNTADTRPAIHNRHSSPIVEAVQPHRGPIYRATEIASSRPALQDRHSLPMLEDARHGPMGSPRECPSDRPAVREGGSRSVSAPPLSANSVGRTLLKARITGATRDGDMCQSLIRPIKLDTGSPENLISSSLRKDLNAELIKDHDYLLSANHSLLDVQGAAMVWLTWNGKDGETQELIYCLVVRTLTPYLIVSEDRDKALFTKLREAQGPWLSSLARSVLTIELDKLTAEQRKDLVRKRETMLALAKEAQAKKDKGRANDRNQSGPQAPQGRR